MGWIASVLGSVLLTAAPSVDAGVSARTEARSNWYAPTDGGPRTATPELSLELAAHAVLKGRSAVLQVAYAPTLLLRGAQLLPHSGTDTGDPANVLHNVTLDLGTRTKTSLRYSARQTFSFGRQDYTFFHDGAATASPGAPVDTLPTSASGLRSTLTLFSRTTAGFDTELSKRWSLHAAAGYQVQGGADADARASGLPLQHGPELEVGLSHRWTRRETLQGRLNAAYATFSNGHDVATVDPQVSLTSRLTRTTSCELAAGAGLLYSVAAVSSVSAEPGQQTFQVIPLTRLSLDQRFVSRHPLTATLAVGTAPYVDRFNGTAYGRAEGSAGLAWNALRTVTVRSNVGFGTPLDTKVQQAQTVVLADASASWQVRDAMELTAGGRWGWQTSPLESGRPFSEWGAFVAFTLRGETGGK